MYRSNTIISSKTSNRSITVWCEPIKNIVFLKTHKCGSSTVQNILLRYGDDHNLTFALPTYGNYLGNPRLFNRRMIPSLNYIKSKFGKVYNIFTHHTRFSYHEIKAVMPSNSVFITIIRDPVSLFESLFCYYDLKNIYSGLSLKDLSDILYSNSPNSAKINFNKRFYGRIGRNQMSFDLGLDSYYFENLKVIKHFIKKLDNYFNLVMISERMDESLILLRHMLCWPIHNVIVFKHNVRYRSDIDNSSTIEFDEFVKSKFRLFNRADQMLYNHFYKKFELEIEKFGFERMKQEIKILKEETHKLYLKCVDKELLLTDLLPNNTYILPKTKILANKVKNTTDPICWSLTAPELLYTDLLKQKQLYLFPENWLNPREL